MKESVIDFPKATLCPEIWEKVVDANGVKEIWQLKPEVRAALQEVYENIVEATQQRFNVIHITGSITSNSYTENADIDMHFLSDQHEVDDTRAEEINKMIRAAYEKTFVGKHPVEVYFQPNKFQDIMSVGCYDFFKNKWLVGPEMTDQSFNPYSEYYKEIQDKSIGMATQIRNMIFSIYEIAVVMKKNIGTEFHQNIRQILVTKLEEVQTLYDNIRSMRKVYSSPTSKEQALEFRSSRKWKIADGAFKLFDKYGYMAILKQFITDYGIISSTSDTDLEVVEDILNTVKKYINNADKLSEKEIYEVEMTDKVNESYRQKLAILFESHEKSVNKYGEEQVSLGEEDQAFNDFNDILKQCKTKSFFKSKEGKETEMSQLKLDSLMKVQDSHYVAKIYGGENGWGRFQSYLDTVKKLIDLTSQKFSRPWLVDWVNDCADDVWTLQIGFRDKSSELNESKKEKSTSSMTPDEYSQHLLNKLGADPNYVPRHTNKSIMDSIAHEYILEMPTDTAAREIEMDAALLLVKSNDEENIKIGKKLGDMVIDGKGGDKILDMMKKAYLAFLHMPSDEANEAEQVDEGAMSNMLLATLLAIPGILPAKTIQKTIDKNQGYEMIVKDLNQNVRMIGDYTAFQAANIIARTLYAEARNDGEKGMNAVASVIYNRAEGDKTLFTNACLKPKQFSCWNKFTKEEADPKNFKIKIPSSVNGNKKNEVLWKAAMQIAADMLADSFKPTTNANMYYNDKTAHPDWGNQLTSVKYIGSHKFGILKNHSAFV